MSKQILADRSKKRLLFADVAGSESLAELALDMRWSWNHGAEDMPEIRNWKWGNSR